MLNIIERITGRPSSSVPTTVADAPATLLADTRIENPDDLRQQLARFEQQIRRDDEQWDALDQATSPRGLLEQNAIASRRPHLEAECDALRARIAAAERRRRAFLQLVEVLDAVDQHVTADAQRLYGDVLTVAQDERRDRIAALDGLVRSRARIAAALAAESSARRFHRHAPDPFGALVHDLRKRAAEIERALGPGMPRAAIEWPTGAQELIATLNEGNRP